MWSCLWMWHLLRLICCPGDLHSTKCVVLCDSLSQNAKQILVKFEWHKVQSFFHVYVLVSFHTLNVHVKLLSLLLFATEMPGRPVQSCVAHGKVCRSVPYNAGHLTSVLTKCQLCPKNPPCDSNHPKFSELPLGGITFPTENHSSNRTQALDGLIKVLLGSIYRYNWFPRGQRMR